MRRILLAAVMLGLAPLHLNAQENLGGYTRMQIDAGRGEGSFLGATRFDRLVGGVKITLLSEDPTLDPLPISAQEMTFAYGPGGERPSRIELTGNVDIKHPDVAVEADQAVWNFETGDLTFTGSPVVTLPDGQELRGSTIVINMVTNKFSVENMQSPAFNLGGGGLAGVAGDAPEDPNLLKAEDVSDWPGFIDAIKADAVTAGLTPGKQLLNQLDSQARQLLMNSETAMLVQNKDAVLEQLNTALRSPNLYDADAWREEDLSEQTRTLLGEEELTSGERIMMNRGLLSAAYPDLLTGF